MASLQTSSESHRKTPHVGSTGALAQVAMIQPSSPRFSSPSSHFAPSGGGSHRRIAIAVDLSDESAYAVKWAIHNYLCPGDTIILLHVRLTSVPYCADRGSADPAAAEASPEESITAQPRKKKEAAFFLVFFTNGGTKLIAAASGRPPSSSPRTVQPFPPFASCRGTRKRKPEKKMETGRRHT